MRRGRCPNASPARELLRHARWHGKPPPALELRYNSNELHNRIAVAVAAMWKQALGIDTTLHAEEFKVLLQDIDRGDVEHVSRQLAGRLR